MSQTSFSMPLSRTRSRRHDDAAHKPRLGERLIAEGVITRAQLEAALKQQATGRKLGETLVDLGLLAETDLLPYLADQFGVPHVFLREGLVDPSVATLIPRDLAETCQVLALFKVHDVLTVAMADPQNLATIDRLERVTGLRVRPVLALLSSVEELIDRVYGDGFQVDSITADLEQDAVSVGDEAVKIDFESLGADGDSSPIINLVNYVLLQAIRQRASDIHIEAGAQHSTVRFRVDGMLREIIRPKKEYHPAIISRLKVMSKMDIAEHRLPQDGRIHVVIDQRPIDLRISTLPTVLGEKAVLRVLDRSSVTFHLGDLGIPERQMKTMNELIHRPNGLFLVTGPTGSGKTTTLYSIIELLKSVETNVVTVEDPVEYRLDLINQVHVNHAAQMSFARALRAILRQDPDIIMIGEIRDLETAEIAIQAALTGHMVFSTLHTNDSLGAIPRLIDMGVAPFKIAAALVGVIAQRLTRRICPHCKTSYYPNPTVLDAIRYPGDRNRQFQRGHGCEKCYDTGYKGRIGIYELLEVNRELRDLISQNAPVEKRRALAVAGGFRTLAEQAIELAENGTTSLDEILRVAVFE
jgi:type IV pilus assembly protein PilB